MSFCFDRAFTGAASRRHAQKQPKKLSAKPEGDARMNVRMKVHEGKYAWMRVTSKYAYAHIPRHPHLCSGQRAGTELSLQDELVPLSSQDRMKAGASG